VRKGDATMKARTFIASIALIIVLIEGRGGKEKKKKKTRKQNKKAALYIALNLE
jgi:hypothetical protein